MTVLEDLLSQTLASQYSLIGAINASASLLLAASIYGQSETHKTILDTEAILKGYGFDSLKRSGLCCCYDCFILGASVGGFCILLNP